MANLANDIRVGAGATVAQDCDIRGKITIGAGCVLHPRCTIIASAGSIIIGDNCIFEENSIIVNKQDTVMAIGQGNLFGVGCRIDSPSVGSHNTFQPKSRVPSSVVVSDWCTIGAGCTVTPMMEILEEASATEGKNFSETSTNTQIELLPPRTVVYGAECARRIWSGEGKSTALALHVKHLENLRDMLPRYLKMKQLPPLSPVMSTVPLPKPVET